LDYRQACEYLISSYGAGRKRGFEPLRAALAHLGEPHEAIPIIHIAGTNGKGSVCAMLGAVLQAAGYRAGAFTSPHLHTFNERFRINGQMIDDEDFARHIARVAEITPLVLGDEMFSYFEILVLVAFLYFYEQKVDFLLLEVGIGGRLDATNVLSAPILSIITSIGFDHMDILGNTAEEIAAEKGGIIKPGRPCAVYNNAGIVREIMENICNERGSHMYYANNLQINISKNNFDGLEFSADCEYFNYPCIKLGMMGDYQVQNAATVLLALAALADLGHVVPRDAISSGLRAARWPGRMELVAQNPAIILEGAHNYDGALHSAAFLQKSHATITLLMGILDDKEYEKIVNLLAPLADCIIFTKPIYDARAVDPAALAACLPDAIKNTKSIIIENDHKTALARAREATDADGIIFCTGSLYLIGDIRAEILKEGL